MERADKLRADRAETIHTIAALALTQPEGADEGEGAAEGGAPRWESMGMDRAVASGDGACCGCCCTPDSDDSSGNDEGDEEDGLLTTSDRHRRRGPHALSRRLTYGTVVGSAKEVDGAVGGIFQRARRRARRFCRRCCLSPPNIPGAPASIPPAPLSGPIPGGRA